MFSVSSTWARTLRWFLVITWVVIPIALPTRVALAADSDMDGLSDALEVAQFTDPNNPDTDGDGLWDGWEYHKRVLTTPLPGANPLVPDVYLEVDYFKDALTPLQMQLVEAEIVSAFDTAPVYRNIAGVWTRVGIKVHFEWDTELPAVPLVLEGAAEIIRDAYFDWNVKALSHRHVLWVHRLQLRDFGAPYDVLGVAAGVPSQSVICAGRYPGIPLTWKNHAVNLMHELGHTFGIGHGGIHRDGGRIVADELTHCKPNHISVMNYSWSFRGLSKRNGVKGVLDYQRFDLPALNELLVDESRGLGPSLPAGVTGYMTLIRPSGAVVLEVCRTAPYVEVPAWSPIDFNQDGDTNDRLFMDLNGDGDLNFLKATLNEWENLKFDVNNRIGARWLYEFNKP